MDGYYFDDVKISMIDRTVDVQESAITLNLEASFVRRISKSCKDIMLNSGIPCSTVNLLRLLNLIVTDL
jgi:hypothetical protein